MTIFDEIVNGVAARVPKPTEEDYVGDDGLKHCHVCNAPKECRIKIGDTETVVNCICKCREAELERERIAFEKLQIEIATRDIRRAGFPDEEMQKWNFDNDDLSNPQLTEAMKRYVENFPKMRKNGKGLLLYGDVGRGKTYAACEVANALIDKGYNCMVTNFARITNSAGSSYENRQKIYDSLNRYHLLVIDDLATERKTEFMNEVVFNVIDARYRQGKPMIITTNLSINELKKPENTSVARIYDRILEMCFPIEVKGENKRHKKIRKDYDEMKELLGL